MVGASSLILAAALSLPQNKVIAPSFGGRVVVRSQAHLTSSEDPGPFQISVFKSNESGAPGEPVENVRISPRTIYLRDNKPTRVTLSISSAGLESGPLWICISEKQQKPSLLNRGGGQQLLVRTQSCYQRLLELKR